MKIKWVVLLVVLLTAVIGLQGVKGWENGRTLVGNTSAPSLWLYTPSLDFGPVPIGETGWWYFTFKNIGNAPLNITSNATFTPPFTGTMPACATNLLPGDICGYIVQFSPIEIGAFNSTFQFETDAGPFSLQLYGESIAPRFYVDPLSLDFGSVLVGNSQTQSIMIYNIGSYHLDLTISSPPSPNFGSSSGDCSGGIAVGDSCIVYLNFEPTQSGVLTDTYTITTSAGETPIALRGSGRSVPFLFGSHQKVTPRSLDFGPVPLGESKTLTVTITNQSFDTDITNWTDSGVAAPFSTSQNCPSSLSTGGSCEFFYTFSPTAEGVFIDDSDVSNSAGAFSIALQGEGAWSEPLVSETILDFGPLNSVMDHEASLRNTGHTRLYLNNVVVSDPAVFSPGWSCGSGLPPYQPNTFCSLNYDFAIASPDLITETSTISTDGGDVIIMLKAGAHAPSLAQSFSPNQISEGGTAILQYAITNPNSATTFYFVTFTNTLPIGMAYADPLSFTASSECGTPELLPVAGNPPIVMVSDGTILGGETCVISLGVTAVKDGKYINTVDYVETGTDPNNPAWIDTSNTATATLTVGLQQLFLPAVMRGN